MAGQSFSRERRERVLERVGVVGLEAAAVEAGVEPRTVERWQAKARASVDVEQVDGELVMPPAPVVSPAPVGGEDAGDLGVQLSRTARAARRAAEKAIARLEEALPTARNPQALAVAVGVMTDKAAQLQRILDEEEERKARLAQGQAQVIAGLFPLALEAAGVPVGPFRPVLGELLRRASEGGPLAVSPAVAQPAYAAVRGYFERVLREELGEDRKALSAGPDEDEHDVATVDRDLESTVADATVGEELAYGEVVSDPERERPFDAAAVARRVFERIQAQEGGTDFGVGRHAPRSGGFDVEDPAASTVRYGGPQRWAP
jgi:hypothetical protein